MLSPAAILALTVLFSPRAEAQRMPRLGLLNTAVLRAPRLVESSGVAPS